MPMFDVVCDSCGQEEEDVFAHRRSEVPVCSHCGGTRSTRYGYASRASAVLGDAIDFVSENAGPTPVRFTSRAERKRHLKEKGLAEFVRHVGVPGTDKSPHTTDWSKGSIDATTLANAEALVGRVCGGVSRAEADELELEIAVESGAVQVPISVGDRHIGLRLGAVYHGVLDPAVLKGQA
jgi:hypothetical protein